MALLDYRKLCAKSGRVLTSDEERAARAGERATGEAWTLRCETCGRTLEVCVDPGTGRSLIYPMHLKNAAKLRSDQGTRSR